MSAAVLEPASCVSPSSSQACKGERVHRRVSMSLEFYPPADAAGETQLWNSLERLALVAPRFVSVTCGAAGATQARTESLVAQIQSRTELAVAPHLTCWAARATRSSSVFVRTNAQAFDKSSHCAVTVHGTGRAEALAEGHSYLTLLDSPLLSNWSQRYAA